MTTRPWNHESGVDERTLECKVCANPIMVYGYECFACDSVNELPVLDDAAACEFANSIIRACAAKRAFGKEV